MTPGSKKTRSLQLALWLLLCGLLWAAAVALLLSRLYALRDASGWRFEHPWFALVGLSLPIMLATKAVVSRKSRPRLRVSRVDALRSAGPGCRVLFAQLPDALRFFALASMTVALMGPQSIHAESRTEVEGIDIAVVMDLSLSMQAADIEPTRFEAMKTVVIDFLRKRPDDRVGAVIFGREAFTLLPLTLDKEALRTLIAEMQLGMIDGQGTAIGNAVATGLNRLRDSKAKSRVLILLTDGNSNSGNIGPSQAAEFASALEVKVYTILMGTSDSAPVRVATDIRGAPVFDQGKFPVDPKLLQDMAKSTGGKAFVATDRRGLARSFHEILDQLEKSDIEDRGRIYGELYPAFVWPALALLFLERIVALWLRRWP